MKEIRRENIFPYQYRAFGLNISSQILIPELMTRQISDVGDVRIKLGPVPESLDNPGESARYCQGEKNRLLISIKNVGKYDIKNGTEIVIDPAETGEIRELRLFLLGSAFGALLWQRGFLPIHGSAVSFQGKCFIISGSRGAGKSTLAAALEQEGCQVLTDDVAGISLDCNGIPWVYPSYPQQKLWKNSLEFLGKDHSPFDQITGRIDKYAVPLQKGFCDYPQIVSAIYEIRKDGGKKVKVAPLSGVDKLSLIINNVYRYGFPEAMSMKEEIFRRSAALAQKVEVFRIFRPEHLLTIEEEKALVLKNLTEEVS